MEENKHSIQGLQKSSQRLEVIHSFALLLLQTTEVDEIVWAVAKHAVARLGYVDCVVYLFDDADEYLVQRAAHGPKNPIDFDINNPIKLKRGQGICGHVALTGKAELIADTSKDERYEIDDDMRLSELAVPILSEGKVIGIIDSEHPEREFYSAQDLEIMTTIAAMASSKIVEARIQARLRDHQKELERLVEVRTKELLKAVLQLSESNELLTRSNERNEYLLREIKSSIFYAKGIQSAILPSKRTIQKYFSDSFILYKPKDIVAGDFYWMEAVKMELETALFFAVADCTGHGVPGAMVSVVCNNALNRSVREYALRDPGEILDQTNKIVKEEFEKSEEVVHDGMDIALCRLQGKELKYAGANNPLLVIRRGEVIEFKANKQPIGRFEGEESFRTHTVYLQEGDCVYLFTDGFGDQFGGGAGKKFKPGNFRTLLLELQDKCMEEQGQLVATRFEEWKGELDQVDDVCIFGFRILSNANKRE
ncbi:MAG: hypothetical protein A3D92_12465 [Bacteroidetes bacterium RIFCSPHIGHO2_02_FULL_44_7]|nr:MAG: hypothetical protein A3D92_12465 [Bacteroidetes bacterium RIFCSPHIGHO2_02_FULL_44_7]